MGARGCTGCYYHSAADKTCNYALVTGHARGCPVDECTVRKEGKRKAKAMTIRKKVVPEVAEYIGSKTGKRRAAERRR